MSDDTTTPKLTGKQEQAAALVAQDTLTDEAIAAEVGIRRATLHAWKQKIPAFNDRVAKLRAEFAEVARKHAIFTVEGRVKEYADRHARLKSVIEQRAERGGDAAGADTGLLVRTYKSIGTGENAYAQEEWAVDTGMLREMRELEKQAAQDLGQWAEKKEHSGPNGGPIPIQAIEVLMDDVTAEGNEDE